VSSDLLITSLRTQLNKSKTKLPLEAISLLDIESSEQKKIETCNSEISSSYSEFFIFINFFVIRLSIR
jgi:hypothetical protein